MYERRRRALRQAMLEPVLVGWPALRQVFTNALAARGHLVLCELGDVRFFVDPSDRVVGAWLMWHGGWQRREIDTAVDLLRAAGRLHDDAVFIDVGAHIGTHTIYALRSGRFTRAIAFEPEPRNARLLAMNLEVNGLSQAAIVVRKAAGATAGNALLHLHPRNTGAHAIGSPPSLDGQVSLEVPMVRLGRSWNLLALRQATSGLSGLTQRDMNLRCWMGLPDFCRVQYRLRLNLRRVVTARRGNSGSLPGLQPTIPAFKASDAATPAGR